MACSLFITSIVFLILPYYGLCNTCTDYKIQSTSFTTEDATVVTNIAYISEFSVTCSSGQIQGMLYAEINGNIVPLPITAANTYQISWTEDKNVAKSGDKTIRIFDDEAYANYRRAVRNEENVQAVKSTFNVVVEYPGTYYGPWIRSELLATIVSSIIAYIAISFKLKVAS